MDSYEPFISLGLALFAGLIIGLEREQSRPTDSEQSFFGGARTYPLIALLGATTTLASRYVGTWLVVLAAAGVFALVAISYAQDVFAGKEHGITSESALLLTFMLGVLSMTEFVTPLTRKLFIVASVTIAATLLLSIKPALHGFIQKASKDDVLSTLKFLVAAVVVLPLLPNETFGPLEVLNPFKIGLMAVLIAGISFVGYVAIRLLGPGRGMPLTGAIGGLVSSTAVTVAFSARAKERPDLLLGCTVAVVLASSIMFGRVIVEVGIVHPALLPRLLIPMGTMGLSGLAVSFVLYQRARGVQQAPAEVQLSNPFELSSALKFALLFAVVLLGVKAASTYLGESGTLVAGLLAGTTDVDAITLSMANLARNEVVSAPTATTAIFLGTGSNTLVKAGLAVFSGGWELGRRVLSAYAVIIAAGALSLVVVWVL
ncbi:MAG: MgtC/SapB family protein [Myxococcota bacterium]